MPTDDPNGRPSPVEGFHSYADDDTPRDWEFRAPYRPSIEVGREDDPLPPPASDASPAGERRGLGKAVVLGGLAVAALAGVFLARDLPPMETRPAAMTPAAPASASPPVNVEVAAAAPAPIAPPSEATRLEVLPPDTPPAATTAALFPRQPARTAPPFRAELAPEPPRALAAEPPAARDAAAVAPDRPPPSFACRDAPTLARQMVCADRGLAEADMRMKHAYAAALAAGAPAEDLRLDQDDWLEIREQAARHSRRAVLSIYRQRIGELEDMARP